jgi:hypothetical protein
MYKMPHLAGEVALLREIDLPVLFPVLFPLRASATKLVNIFISENEGFCYLVVLFVGVGY